MNRPDKFSRDTLFSGITTYSPPEALEGPGKKVGVVGPGHMGVKMAKAMVAEVIIFTKIENAK